MDNLSMKLERQMARQIERDIREFNYSTKTEFIRESIRDKLRANEEERRKKKAWESLFAARGIFKGKGKAKTEEEFYKLREEAGKEIMEHYEKKFGLNLLT